MAIHSIRFHYLGLVAAAHIEDHRLEQIDMEIRFELLALVGCLLCRVRNSYCGGEERSSIQLIALVAQHLAPLGIQDMIVYVF